MPPVRYNVLLRAFWRLHRALFRLSGGRIGSRIAGHDVLFLTTAGRKSGEPRTVGLYYVETDDGPAVIGSYAGEDRDPAWVRNLRSDPVATVQLETEEGQVRARLATGEERNRLIRRFIEEDAAYRVYQERTDRKLPIFVLEPIS